MLKDNIVVFKGRKDGITVMLDDKTEFEYLKHALGKKVVDARKFFGGAKAAIAFQGRRLTDDEEVELLSIICKEANLDISFVTNKNNASIEVSQRNRMNSQLEQSYGSKLFASEHMTTFHASALRSGQSIRYAGSVVILGDINPGAEVIAEGNIIVLGAAKGLVHAGCTGNTECFISAVRLIPVQLRIADIITYIPNEMEKKNKNKKKMDASYAYIQNGQIYIAPLVNG